MSARRSWSIALSACCWLQLGGAAAQPPAPGAAAAPAAAAPPPAPAPAAPEVVPPRLIGDAVIEYPPGASGAADVLLELVVSASGEVREVRSVTGSEPFVSAAIAAARGWRFEPARRGEQPVAARIRFQVSFSEPAPAPAPPPAAAAAPGAPKPAPPIQVTVTGERAPPLTQSLTRAEVRQLPGAFGDPFRAIEALPGVTPIASGVPFFYVRGAPPGNVGYFLDGMRLPLLYHVGLGPSVVHPAMVSRVDLYPGAYPTRYGRFAGGIVAGEVSEPADRLWGEWQLRLFDVGAMAEAPFAGGRGHVLLGGRYSYTAYLISLLGEEVRLEYWDYQLRTSYRLSAADTLGVFVFGSFDYFGEDTSADDDDVFSSEFHRVDLRYRHEAGPHSELTAGLTLGLDRTRVAENSAAARNRRAELRSEYHTRLSAALELRAGLNGALDYYSVDSGLVDDVDDSEPPPPTFDENGQVVFSEPPFEQEQDDVEEEFRALFPTRLDHVLGAHLELGWDADHGVRVVPGLRADVYASDGALALSLEPRISAEFRISEALTLKHGLGLAAQPPSFVLPVAGLEIGGLPGGLQRSVQSSAGLEYALPEGMKLSLTAFHNAFFRLTDLLSLARTGDSEDLEIDSRTLGQSYGLELMFHRDLTRRLGGFLAYTLSRSVRSTSFGKIPSSFDRTHVLNAALGYDLGSNWRLGGRFVFYTGNPSFSLELRSTPEVIVSPNGAPTLGDAGDEISLGGERLPPYYRLDLRIEKRWLLGESGQFCSVVLELLNSTLSKEVLSRNCDSDGCHDETIGPVTIPSLSFEGRF